MNRRGFIELLAALPMCGFLKPAPVKGFEIGPAVGHVFQNCMSSDSTVGFYVTPDGSLSEALSRLKGGHTLILRDGEYRTGLNLVGGAKNNEGKN